MKNIKDPNISSLISDFAYAIKKNKKYGNFIANYMPFDTNHTLSLHKLVKNNISTGVINQLPTKVLGTSNIIIGEHIFYKSSVGINYDDIFKGILGKVFLLNEMLIYKKLTIPEIRKEKLLEYYIKEEISKRNIKVYPNNLVFVMTLGAIFAVIGFFSILLILWYIFGFLGCLMYSLFVLIILRINPKWVCFG